MTYVEGFYLRLKLSDGYRKMDWYIDTTLSYFWKKGRDMKGKVTFHSKGTWQKI